MIAPELAERIKKIKLLIVDNDGVMTDGRIVYGDYGDELKFFDVQDGFGLVLLRRAGIPTVMISGKKCRINQRRAKEISIDKVYQNVFDKLKAFDKVLRKYRVGAHEVCAVADDLVDLPILKRAGVAVAVQNAVDEVREAAHYVTAKRGGRGALREVCDLILKTQGSWTKVTQKYYQ